MSGVDFRSGSSALEAPKAVSSASEVASHWRATGSALANNVQAVQNASIPTEQWSGQTAQAVVTEIQTMGTKVSSLSGKFPEPAGVLETWRGEVDTAISEVKTLQEEWDSELSNYCDRVAQIEADAASDPDYDREAALARARQEIISKQSDLKSSYDKKITALSTAASEAAKTINGIADSVVPRDAVKAGRNAVGAAIFGSDTPIVDSAAEWQYAQELAPKMAEDFEKAADAKKPLTVEEVRDLQNKWGDKLKNPFCVQAMMDFYRSKHSGEKNAAVEMLYKVAVNTAGSDYDRAKTGTERNSLIDSLGTAMVLSTGGYNTSGDESRQAHESFIQMKDALLGKDGRTTVSQIEDANIAEYKDTLWNLYPRFVNEGTYSPQVRGGDLFTQAAGYAALSDSSLTFGPKVYQKTGDDPSLASEIMRFDHNFKSGLNVFYGGASSQAATHPLVAFDESKRHIIESFAKDPMQALYLLSDTPDGIKSEGMERFEANRLSSLREFLNEDTPFNVELHPGASADTPLNVARYLTGTRNYGNPAFRGFVDQGDAFGKMIEDATRPFDDRTKELLGPQWEKAANSQATVVGNYIAGYQDGLDFDDEKDGAQDKFGTSNPKLRSRSGTILANWAESFALADADNANGSDSSNPNGTVDEGRRSDASGRAQFTLSPKLRDSLYTKTGLFADLAFDNPKQTEGEETDTPFDDKYDGGRPPALSVIQAAAYAGYKHDLLQTMGSDYHIDPNDSTPGTTWDRRVSSRVNKWGTLFQHLAQAPANVEALDHEEVAKRNQRIRQGIDALASLVPTDKIPGSKIVQALTSSAVEEQKNTILDQILPTDFKSEDLAKQIASYRGSNETLADTLAETYSARSEWPNPDEKTKDELVAQFLKEEAVHNDGVVPQGDGSLPSYNAMTEAQQSRFRGFLKEFTYLRVPLEEAGNVTWRSFVTDSVTSKP